MGSPCFYWYPAGSTTLEITQLPRLTRLEPVDAVDVQDGYTGNLTQIRTYGGTRRRVRLTIERHSMLSSAGATYYQKLQAVIEHLRGGGAVGFSQNHDYTWAGYSSGTWVRGYSYFSYSGNAFSSWNGSAAPANGQGIVAEAAPIYPQSEAHSCTGLSGGSQITISDTVTFDYTGISPVMVRWDKFWPALRMPADKLAPPLSNEHAIAWTFDLTLEVDASIFWAAGDQYQQQAMRFALGSTTSKSGMGSLDSILAAVRNREARLFR